MPANSQISLTEYASDFMSSIIRSLIFLPYFAIICTYFVFNFLKYR